MSSGLAPEARSVRHARRTKLKAPSSKGRLFSHPRYVYSHLGEKDSNPHKQIQSVIAGFALFFLFVSLSIKKKREYSIIFPSILILFLVIKYCENY